MTLPEVFTRAVFNPLPLAAIAVATAWYLFSVRRVEGSGQRWPLPRTSAFVAAAAVLLLAWSSGIDGESKNFAVHAIQQVLVAMVAPIGLALSAPITLALEASGEKTRAAITRALASRFARVVTNPVFTWGFYGLTIYGLYFTSLYALTLHHAVLRSAMQVLLFVAGCLYWWLVAGSDPLPNRLNYWPKIVYLILAMPFHTILGMSLESQTTSIAPSVPLSQLHVGGGLMWVAGEAAGLLGAIAVFVQWLRADELEAKRRDQLSGAAADRQLAHWRSTRDAAARAADRMST